jgi:hypothetical protein
VKEEAVYSSETPVNFYRATWSYIQKDSKDYLIRRSAYELALIDTQISIQQREKKANTNPNTHQQFQAGTKTVARLTIMNTYIHL